MGSAVTTNKKVPIFKAQAMMNKVIIALIPCLLGSIYFFGWRVLALLLWVVLLGSISEHILAKKRGDSLTTSCLVSCLLFTLSLPPNIPFWIAGVGIVFGIVFGKEVYGGFGRNVFNPAIVGRAFVYVGFPIQMTSQFSPVWEGGLAGFTKWGAQKMIEGIDAISAATPMWSRRDFNYETSILKLFFGNITDVYTASDGVTRSLSAGSIGEVSAVLILIGAIYLFITKTASWRLSLGSLLGGSAFVLLFNNLLGNEGVPPLMWSLLSGGFLYATIFMVTDPISAPRDKTAQLIYGFLIGALIIFFRWKAAFAGGVAFAIILGNTLSPLIDMFCKSVKNKKKAIPLEVAK